MGYQNSKLKNAPLWARVVVLVASLIAQIWIWSYVIHRVVPQDAWYMADVVLSIGVLFVASVLPLVFWAVDYRKAKN